MNTRWIAKIGLISLVTATAVGVGGCELFTFSNDARRKGLALYEQGNYTDAAGSFSNAVRQRPTDYKSFYYLGQSYEKLDRQQLAIQNYKSARDSQRQTGEGIQDTAFRDKILDALAGAIAKSTDREREIQILRERAAVARNGEDLITLARVFKAAGDPDSAIGTYRQAVDKYPREQIYFLEYGNYLASVGLKERARQVYNAGLSIKPDPDLSKALQGL